MKTKRFGGWICSLLQVECGDVENIQTGLLLEKFVLLSDTENVLDRLRILVISQVTWGR
jgi:hypothetical protein